MGRQFRAYLLPADMETVMHKLAQSGDLQMFRDVTEDPRTLVQQSPFVESHLLRGGSAVRCFLAPPSADVTYRYIEKRGVWHIDHTSEVVEVSGFDCDSKVLVQGRMYYQVDYVKETSICSKGASFVHWAESLFRSVKKDLVYSAKLQAYVGEGAQRFLESGGRFTAMICPNVEPVYEVA